MVSVPPLVGAARGGGHQRRVICHLHPLPVGATLPRWR